MAKFNRYNHTEPSWGDVIIDTSVKKIDFLNKEYGDKFKSVFYCKSEKLNQDRMCVYWQGLCTIKLNDEVLLKGKMSKDIFLVSSYQIKQRR